MAKRTRLNRPYPTQSLQDALPISQTIQDANGGNPVETGLLAESIGTSVKSSLFVQKLKSSSMYGLTIGAHTDETIELTDLGERLTAPASPEERAESVRQAALAPDVFRKFYAAYGGKPMPGDVYAANTLTRQLGLDERLADECLGIVKRNGLFAGVIEERAGALTVAPIDRTGGRASEESAPYESTLFASAAAARAGRENGGDGGDVHPQTLLIAAEPGDPAGEAALAVARGLGVAATSAALEPDGAALVSGELAAALESARGCVFVFPNASTLANGEDGKAPVDSARRSARAWASLGAALGRLGSRTVVIRPGGESDANGGAAASASFQDLAGGSVAAVERSDGAALFAVLAPALIQAGIIRVSVG